MKILLAGEALTDQLRSYDLAVLLDQGSIGLPRKNRLSDAGHAERIEKARDDRKDQKRS